MADEKAEQVKAADILAYAADETHTIEVGIVDDEDLYPFLSTVEVQADPDDHKCSLSGYYTYLEDSPRHGINFGSCEFSILGVTFSTPYDDHSDFSTSGKEIDYGGMDQDEFWGQLQEHVEIPTYDPWENAYEFDESEVTDEDIKEHLESSYSVYAIDADGEVCAFESADEVPADDEENGVSYEIIDEETAFAQLASDRPGLEFDQG